VLPDDGPVGPKHVGAILKLILICVEGFKVWKILKQYISASSWFYNLFIKDYCTVQKWKCLRLSAWLPKNVEIWLLYAIHKSTWSAQITRLEYAQPGYLGMLTMLKFERPRNCGSIRRSRRNSLMFFILTSIPVLGPTQPLVHWVLRFFLWGREGGIKRPVHVPHSAETQN